MSDASRIYPKTTHFTRRSSKSDGKVILTGKHIPVSWDPLGIPPKGLSTLSAEQANIHVPIKEVSSRPPWHLTGRVWFANFRAFLVVGASWALRLSAPCSLDAVRPHGPRSRGRVWKLNLEGWRALESWHTFQVPYNLRGEQKGCSMLGAPLPCSRCVPSPKVVKQLPPPPTKTTTTTLDFPKVYDDSELTSNI